MVNKDSDVEAVEGIWLPRTESFGPVPFSLIDVVCFSYVFLGDQHSDIPASVSHWIHTTGHNSFKVHQVSAAWAGTLFGPSSCEMLGSVPEAPSAVLQHPQACPAGL